MATVSQSIHADAPFSNVITAGRDVYISGAHGQKPEFSEPTFDRFTPPVYPDPPLAQSCFQQLYKHRLLLLGGDPEIDKDAFARYLAAFLRVFFIKKKGISKEAVIVREWDGSNEQQRFETELIPKTDVNIYILPQLTPKNIRHDLSTIYSCTQQSRVYVIASTNIPRPAWKLSERDSVWWRELEAKKFYDGPYLAELLYQALLTSEESLQAKLDYDRLRINVPLLPNGNRTIRTLAHDLGNASNIAFFVRLLVSKRGPFDDQAVESLLHRVQSGTTADKLIRWYRILNYREQLLALSLGFFEGLIDSQFFAALEVLMSEAWSIRDRSLRAFDSVDLDNLRDFFEPVRMRNRERKIQSRPPYQRSELLKIAWEMHYRQIVAALPVLVRLVTEVVDGQIARSELYGTDQRRRQLRSTISEALSDIGLLSSSTVQPTLLTLAVNPNIHVQLTAARAVARWRDYNADNQLFDILHKWLENKQVLRDVKSLLHEAHDDRDPRAVLHAFCALTLGIAAQYDSPNQISPKLLDILDITLNDNDPLVQHYVTTQLLDTILPRHLAQLQERLHNQITKPEAVSIMSNLLTQIYVRAPETVWNTLEQWFKDTLRLPLHNRIQAEPREYVLATIITTYGSIIEKQILGPLTPELFFRRIDKLLAHEKHTVVREAIMTALTRQIHIHSQHLQDSVDKITVAERRRTLVELTKLYLEEREHLQNGEETVRYGGKNFEVWIRSARPRTRIESILYNWMKHSQVPHARRIALEAFVAFADALDRHEPRLIRQVQERRQQAALEASSPIETFELPIIGEVAELGWYEHIFVPWSVTWQNSAYRKTITDLLPEALGQYLSRRAVLAYVLSKWQLYDRDADVRQIARMLDRALLFIEYKRIVLGVLLVSSIVVACIVLFILLRLVHF